MKKIGKATIIVSSVLGAIIIAVIVLSFLNVNSFGALPKYSSVSLYNGTSSDRIDIFAVSENESSRKQTTKLDNGLAKSKFNFMQACLEGKWNASFEMLEITNKDKVKEVKKYYSKDIDDFKAKDGEFLLVFKYDGIQSIKVDSAVVKFDRLKVVIPKNNSEIIAITMLPYIFSDYDTNLLPENEGKYATAFTAYANTFSIHTACDDIVNGKLD